VTTRRSAQPLAGRTVVVTRPQEQAAELVRQLEQRGATVIVAPAIEIVSIRTAALTSALRDLADGLFDWVTITSPRTVDVFREHMAPRDVRARVAAIGDGTAEAFRQWTRRDPD
jgi:uroporphyrinogen-III synthase